MWILRALMAPYASGIRSDVAIPTDANPYVAQVQKDFMRKAENWNRERLTKLRRLRNRNIVTGLLLAGSVVSVYAYSILAIRQETFLDDLNEPEREE